MNLPLYDQLRTDLDTDEGIPPGEVCRRDDGMLVCHPDYYKVTQKQLDERKESIMQAELIKLDAEKATEH